MNSRTTIAQVLLLLLFYVQIFDNKRIDITSNNEIITVHIVSHSHCDPGWLRPVDEYYTYEVQYILDSVFHALRENPKRKFIQVEMAYFTRWWNDQTEVRKLQFKELVSNGQLEFVNGGWVMNDEAATYFVDIIDQMTLGHEFLYDEFGATPKIAWHIDPFGSSNMSPGLWAMSGMDIFVINRIDWRLKEDMKLTQELEFVWQGIHSLGSKAEIFTHVMDSHYCTPKYFNWEHGVTQDLPKGDGPPPIIINPPSYLSHSNIHERALEWANISKTRAAWYATPHVLIPFGCDFNFQNALMKYKNMDLLIEYINQHSEELGIQAQYSTLTDYFNDVYNYQTLTNKFWGVRAEDFFPYASDNISYWAGYYTSRPDLKQLARESMAILQNAEELNAIALAINSGRTASFNQSSNYDNLLLSRKAVALVQHHDAITGTERRVAYRDYKQRLEDGNTFANTVASAALSVLSNITGIDANTTVLSNSLLNNKPVTVLVYNSLEFTRTQYLKLNIPINNVQVTLVGSNQSVPFDVSVELSYHVFGYSLFIQTTTPPLGYQTYLITPLFPPIISSPAPFRLCFDEETSSKTKSRIGATDLTISNEYLSANFSSLDGQLKSITNLQKNFTLGCVHNFKYYTPLNDSSQSSDAYVFRPSYDLPASWMHVVEMTYVPGPLVDQIQLVYNESDVTQVFRIYKNLPAVMGQYLEIENHLGPVNVSNTITGKEIVTHFTTAINNEQETFYTDDNGMEMQLRYYHANGRPGDNDTGVELAGNYYPIPTRIFINDSNWQFTALVSHSKGGSSLGEGHLEVMLHRRCMINDRRGVGQALDDVHQTTPFLFLLSDDPVTSSRLHRKLANVLNYPLQAYFSNSNLQQEALPSYSAFTADLPENVRMISLKQRDGSSKTVLFRLMNIFQTGEYPSLAQPVSVELDSIFAAPLRLSNIQERTLTTMFPAADNQRPLWNTFNPSGKTEIPVANNSTVVLYPMEIRTFWAEF